MPVIDAPNTTHHFFGDTDRYAFDFGPCSYKKGFAQVDTSQDASYYGNWTNPALRWIVTYAEGDLTIEKCPDDKSYTESIRRMADWLNKTGYGCNIDAMCDQGMIDRFAELGLSDLLHQPKPMYSL